MKVLSLPQPSMKPKNGVMPLGEAATDLIDAGCLALLYNEELAEHGTLQIDVYPEGLRSAISMGDTPADSESATARAKHVLQNVESVTVDDQTVPFWTDIAVGGIDSLGRQPLYVHESVASNAEFGVSEQPLDKGLAAVAAILQEDE